jgi:hypothetical protein
MKTSRIALLAALGLFAIAVPASAAPSVSGSTDVRADKPAMILAQSNATRAASEARGGDYKATKKKKKKAKKSKKSKK